MSTPATSCSWAMPPESGDGWSLDYERGRPGWPRGAVACPDGRALPGTAEGIPLPDASVDVVFAGPREPSTAAVEELLTDRRPPGDLGFVPLDHGGPHASSGWRPGVDGAPFRRFEATMVANPHRLDSDGLVWFHATMGRLADLPDQERRPLLAEVRALLTAAEYRRLSETHVR